MRIRAVFGRATCFVALCSLGISIPRVARAQEGSKTNSQATGTQPPVVRIGGNIMQTRILHMVMPVYPTIAREVHESGTVVLHAIIGEDGSVKQLQYISGPSLLKKAAMDAVQQWKYKPYMLNGQPVSVDTTISVVFNLSGGPKPSPGGESSGTESSGNAPAAKAASGPVGASAAPPAAGAAGASGAEIDAQFKANILKVLDLTHAMSLGHDAAARMLQGLRPTLIAALPPTPHREQIADAYGDKLTSLLTGQEMANQLVEIYARHLSADDVSGMIQFYQTPAGQHALAALPQIMAESQQLGANVAQENLPRILRELCTEFPELRGKVKFCPAGSQNESGERMEKEWPVVSAQWSAGKR